MNVISKFYITLLLCFLFSLNLFSSDTFTNDISLGLGLNYGKDTVNRHNFSFLPTLGYRFFFFKDIKEKVLQDNPEEYDDEYKSAPKITLIMKSSFFLDTFIKLKFSDSNEYQDFLKQEKTYFDVYFGLGYLMHLRNRIYMTFYGGGNFYKETSKMSFNEKNASPDLKMTYEGNSHSFTDYGGYIGFETLFFMSKTKLKNVFTVSIDFTYNYKMVLKEHNLDSTLNVAFKF